LAGIAATAAMAFSFEAIVIAPALLWLLLRPVPDRAKRFAAFLAGTLVSGLTLVAIFAATGSLGAAIDALVHYDALYQASALPVGPRAWFYDILAYGFPWVLAGAVLIAVAVFSLVSRRWRPRLGPGGLGVIALLWLLPTMAWLLYGSRFYSHYTLFLEPAVLLAFGVILMRIGRLSTMRQGLILQLVLIGCVLAGFDVQTQMPVGPMPGVEINDPVVAYIDAHSAPSDLIYVWGHAPQIYWQSDRAPDGRYFYLLPLMTKDYGQAAVAETLAAWEAHPPVIVVDASQRPSQAILAPLLITHPIIIEDQRNLSSPLEPLRTFIREHYTYVGTYSGQPIYQWRNP
jgi:hypothetical protein